MFFFFNFSWKNLVFSFFLKKKNWKNHQPCYASHKLVSHTIGQHSTRKHHHIGIKLHAYKKNHWITALSSLSTLTLLLIRHTSLPHTHTHTHSRHAAPQPLYASCQRRPTQPGPRGSARAHCCLKTTPLFSMSNIDWAIPKFHVQGSKGDFFSR